MSLPIPGEAPLAHHGDVEHYEPHSDFRVLGMYNSAHEGVFARTGTVHPQCALLAG